MSTELRLASWQSAPAERLRRIGMLKPAAGTRSTDVPATKTSARSVALLLVLAAHVGVLAFLLTHSAAEPLPPEKEAPPIMVSLVRDPAPEPEVVPLLPEPPKPEPVIEPPRFGAAYLSNPAPQYPRISRRLGEEGSVLLRVLVAQSGDANTVEVEKGSGSDRLDEAALEAVKKWKFIPAKRNNQPISAYVLVPIKFSLQNS